MKFLKQMRSMRLFFLKSKIINSSSISHPDLVGENVNVTNSILDGPITIGENCIVKDCLIQAQEMTIGKNTSFWGPGITIHSLQHPIKIGSYCSIAKNVTIQEYSHSLNKVSSYFMFANIFGGTVKDDVTSKGQITIGNDVWIAANAVIGSGVKIGSGAVIGANSVVLNDVPPYAVVAGAPANILRFRFSPEIINKLLLIEWWNWDYEKIKRNQIFFSRELSIDQFDEIR